MTPTFDAFTRNSPDAVAAVDGSGILTFANPHFCTLLKIPLKRPWEADF